MEDIKMTTKPRLHLLSIALLLALVFSFTGQAVLASSGTFDVSVYHGINGRSLGLSKELPVDISIYKDGELLTTIVGFTFKSRLETQLPAGEYLITVSSQEAGPLPSMTVGPVEIPAGAQVDLHARLGANKTPIIAVKVR
jgi:hypothetical protein